eukprot:11211637-Lingulodinium_polyedra.AAC.1
MNLAVRKVAGQNLQAAKWILRFGRPVRLDEACQRQIDSLVATPPPESEKAALLTQVAKAKAMR